MKLSLRPIGLLVTGALALALAACGSDSTSSPELSDGGLTTLKVGTMGLVQDAAIELGMSKGYFKDEGLTVETTVIANPPAGIAAAQSGQLDLTYTPSIPTLTALAQGVQVTIVAAADGFDAKALQQSDLTRIDGTAVIVGKDSPITSAAELEGKTVAVQARKAFMEVTIANAVAKAGGDPSKINWMVLDFSSAVQSLKQGRIDAAGLIAPFTLKAIADGGKIISSPGIEFYEGGTASLWVTGKSTEAKKKAQLQAFARAIHKANAYANENPDEAREVSAKVTDTPVEVLQGLPQVFWPTSVGVEDIELVNNKLAKLGYLSQEVKIDDSLFLSEN